MHEGILKNGIELAPSLGHTQLDFAVCFTKLRWTTGSHPQFQKLSAGVPNGYFFLTIMYVQFASFQCLNQ